MPLSDLVRGSPAPFRPTRNGGRAGAVLGAIGFLAAFALPVRAEDCTLQQIASLPMIENEQGSPVVSVLIDGQPRTMLIDTGGFWSLLEPRVAALYPVRNTRVQGLLGLGAIKLSQTVQVPSVQIGPVKIDRVDFFVEPAGYGSGIEGTLGANWLKVFDVEIDPVENTVTLISQKHCDGGVVHWPHQDVATVPVDFNRAEGRITIPMTLDGKELRALIDTGAAETILSLRAAERLFGLKPDSPGVLPNGSISGKNGRAEPAYRYQFNALEMDGIAFKNAWLTLAATVGNEPDLILGMHQLRGLHLYFAYGEKKLYATTARGDIAARRAAGMPDSAPAARRPDPLDRINAQDFLRTAAAAIRQKDYDRAAAELDRAVKADPGYAPTHVVRASLYAEKGDRDRALKEIDEAIRSDPRNISAYLVRSRLYQVAGDYERAFGDADRAVQLTSASPEALNNRCWFGAILGRLNTALLDCDAALKAAPGNSAILDSRGFVHLKAGRLDQAIDDYDSAIRIEPRSASSLYGRGLAKRQKGDLAGGDADIAAAQRIEPTIAQQFGK